MYTCMGRGGSLAV